MASINSLRLLLTVLFVFLSFSLNTASNSKGRSTSTDELPESVNGLLMPRHSQFKFLLPPPNSKDVKLVENANNVLYEILCRLGLWNPQDLAPFPDASTLTLTPPHGDRIKYFAIRLLYEIHPKLINTGHGDDLDPYQSNFAAWWNYTHSKLTRGNFYSSFMQNYQTPLRNHIAKLPAWLRQTQLIKNIEIARIERALDAGAFETLIGAALFSDSLNPQAFMLEQISHMLPSAHPSVYLRFLTTVPSLDVFHYAVGVLVGGTVDESQFTSPEFVKSVADWIYVELVKTHGIVSVLQSILSVPITINGNFDASNFVSLEACLNFIQNGLHYDIIGASNAIMPLFQFVIPAQESFASLFKLTDLEAQSLISIGLKSPMALIYVVTLLPLDKIKLLASGISLEGWNHAIGVAYNYNFVLNALSEFLSCSLNSEGLVVPDASLASPAASKYEMIRAVLPQLLELELSGVSSFPVRADSETLLNRLIVYLSNRRL